MKNLSKLFILTIFCMLTENISAQTFSVRAGFNTSGSSSFDFQYTTNEGDLKINPGYHFGVMLEIPLSKIFSFDTGFIVNKQSRKSAITSATTGNIRRSQKSHTSVIVPLAIKGFITTGKNTKIYGSAGPYVGFYVKPDVIIRTIERDYGLTFGTGIERGKFQFGISYTHGTTDVILSLSNGLTIRNITFSIFASYKLQKKEQ